MCSAFTNTSGHWFQTPLQTPSARWGHKNFTSTPARQFCCIPLTSRVGTRQGHRTAGQRSAFQDKLRKLIFSFQDRQIHHKLIYFSLLGSETKRLLLTVGPLGEGNRWHLVVLPVAGQGYQNVLNLSNQTV